MSTNLQEQLGYVDETPSYVGLSDNDKKYIAALTLQAAGGENDEFKQNVISTVLNRMKRSNKSAKDVILEKNQYYEKSEPRFQKALKNQFDNDIDRFQFNSSLDIAKKMDKGELDVKPVKYWFNPAEEQKLKDKNEFNFSRTQKQETLKSSSGTPFNFYDDLSEKDQVMRIQEKLIEKGEDPGVVDGKMGRNTIKAIKSFQKKNDLKDDGIVGNKTWDLLGMLKNFVDPVAHASEIDPLQEQLGYIDEESFLKEKLGYVEENPAMTVARGYINYRKKELPFYGKYIKGFAGAAGSLPQLASGFVELVGQRQKEVNKKNLEYYKNDPDNLFKNRSDYKNIIKQAEQDIEISDAVIKKGQELTKRNQEFIKKAGLDRNPDDPMYLKVAYDLGHGTTSILSSIGAGLLNPALPFVTFGGTQYINTFNEYMAKTGDISKAESKATQAAISEGGLEFIASKMLLSNYGGRIKNIVGKAIGEGLTEASQTTGEGFIKQDLYGTDKIFNDALYSFAIGSALGGGSSLALDSGIILKDKISQTYQEKGINPEQADQQADKVIEKMEAEIVKLANEEVAPDIKDQLKDFKKRQNIAVEEVLPAEQLPEIAPEQVIQQEAEVVPTEIIPEQKQDEFEQVTISGALGYQPTQKQKPKVKKTFTPEQLAAAREGKPIELTSDQQKIKLPVYRSEDKITAFKNAADLMRNIVPSAINQETNETFATAFPILSNEGITQKKLSRIQELIENNEELGVDQQRIFNLVSEQVLDVQTVAEDEIDTVQQFINQYKESFPDVTDAQLKEIYEEARQETEDSWDEEIEQAVIKGFIQKADQSRKSAEQTEITPSGQVRLGLQAPIKTELFQEKGELFEGLQEPPSQYGKQSNWKRMASKLLTEQDVETALERLYASKANQEIIDIFETRLEQLRQTDREFEDDLGAGEDEFVSSGLSGNEVLTKPTTDLTPEMEEPINMADKEFAMQYGRYLENKDNLNSAGAKSIEELASNLRATAEDIGYVKGGFKGATDKQLIEAAEDAYVYFLREPSAEYGKEDDIFNQSLDDFLNNIESFEDSPDSNKEIMNKIEKLIPKNILDALRVEKGDEWKHAEELEQIKELIDKAKKESDKKFNSRETTPLDDVPSDLKKAYFSLISNENYGSVDGFDGYKTNGFFGSVGGKARLDYKGQTVFGDQGAIMFGYGGNNFTIYKTFNDYIDKIGGKVVLRKDVKRIYEKKAQWNLNVSGNAVQAANDLKAAGFDSANAVSPDSVTVRPMTKKELEKVSPEDVKEFFPDDTVLEPEAQYSLDYTKAEKNAIIESETKAAYGSEQKYSENVRKALKDLEAIHSNKRSSDVRTLREIARKLEAREPIEYKGSEVTSAQDAAELFALYRHPFIEHFQVIFVKDGKVVSNRVLTSGAAAYVSLDESVGKEIKNEMDSVGADSVYIAHNHPAGNPDPSFADIKYTIAIGDILGKKFKGHVVTNGDQYVLINYDGKQTLNNFKTKKPNYFIASDQIKSIDAAARLARDVIATKAPSIMYFNNQMKFLMAETVTKTTVGEEVNEGLKRNQARYAIVVHDKNTVKQRQLNLNNVYLSDFYGLRDYIIFDKDSYVSMADGEIYPYFKTQSGFPKGVTQILEKPAEYNSDFEGKKTPLGLPKNLTDEALKQEIDEDFGEVAQERTRKISGSVLEAVSELISTDYQLAMDIALLKKPERGGLRAEEIYTGLRLKAIAEQDIDTLYQLIESRELATKARELGQRIKALDSGLENDPVKVAKAINKERDEANKGKSDKQKEAEITKLKDMLSETEKRLNDVEAELKKIKERQPKGSFGEKNKIVKKDKFEQARQALKLKLANSIAEPPAEYNKKTDAGESSILDDVTTMGMFYFEGGVKNYNEWARLIESDLGAKIKPYLQPAWKNVQNQYHQEELKELKERVVEKSVESQRVEDISYIVQLVAKSYVAQGVTSREALVEKVRDLLKDAFPGITSREVADAISGYGKYSQLKQDQIEQKLSDIKGQLLQISKLEDMQKGKSPLKTGRERRKVSDEERRLIKLVDEAKKKYDIKVTDPRRQLRTALDEYKQRIKNQIIDLQKQIVENKQFIKKPTDLKLDEDAKILTARRDELRKTYQEIFGKKEMSVEKRIELAEKSLKRSIETYEEKIAKGDISPLTKKKTPLSTPKLEELRTKKNALKDQLKMLRDMANPKKSAQEIALQSLKTRLKNEQETLLNRLENMDFAKKERKELELDLEAKELRSERDKIRRAFKAAQYNQDHLTKNEVAEIVRLSTIASEAKQKVLDSGDWTANNAKDVEAFFQAKYNFDEYVDSLKPITASDVINNVVDYMRASILASPRILRNSFLYQIVPATERAIAKRIVFGSFDDADLQSTFTEKVMAKLSSLKFTKEENDFIKKQIAMAIRIYHKTGYDISRTDSYDREPRYFGERVGKIKGKGVVSRVAKTVNLAPKWFAGGSDMLFANLGRVETAIMKAKERAKLENIKNMLPEGMTEKDRAKELVIESYSFETKENFAMRIRGAGIRDAHMMNNTQPEGWSDKVIEFRRGLSFGKINFGKALIPFAKIANVVIAEGAKTASGVGIAKAIYDINQATRESDLNVRAEKMDNAVNSLVRYSTLLGAAMLFAMLLDDDDYVGSWDTISRTEYALARAKGAGANYVRIAGKWIPLRYLPMINIPISAIMTARQAKSRGKDAIAGYLSGMIGQILDAPGISETKSILERFSWAVRSDNMEKAVKSLGLDWEGMSNWAKVRVIPSVLSYDIYNAIFDEDKRYDFLGRDIKRGGVFRDDKTNDIILEYSRLSKKGLTPSISDPQSKSAKALKEELGEDEYYKLLAGFKKDYAELVGQTINTSIYKKAPDEEKQKGLNRIRKSTINNALDVYYYKMNR